MLEHLYIKNVALINEIEIDFKSGLNILTGETGAGKSIIIDSINFVLGERPNKDFIHTGAEKATVEALMIVNNDLVICDLREIGISIDDDNGILITRTINLSGKTICKINGKTITVSMLKDVSSLLIDVHGQHEHQSLLNSSKHIMLLDRFCEENLSLYKKDLDKKYKCYKDIIKDLKDIEGNDKEKNSKIELYQYQINEINIANLQKDEEKNLFERRKILGNSEKLKQCTEESLQLLYNSDTMSALERVSASLKNLRDICNLDSSQEPLYEELETVWVQLEDVIRQMRYYNDNIENNSDELNNVENRLNLIYNLKRKYGGSVEEILEYYDIISNKLQIIENSEEERKKFLQDKNKIKNEINELCQKITNERKKYALDIEKKIENTLKDLGMKKALFEISIEKKTDFSANGWDKVEFLISPNPGEQLKPLSKIASGGEMSRVMLALKAVLAEADTIETFIFDEIDTGVSGRTAQQVAEKLNIISKTHQILCITHLPQIAAMGDSHFLIEKIFNDNSTTTIVEELNCDKMISELARLIGGAEITQATFKAAKEMKELTLKVK